MLGDHNSVIGGFHNKTENWSTCKTQKFRTVLPDRTILIGQKLVENAKIKKKSKWDILGDFQTMWNGKVQSYLQDRDLKVTRGLKASRISQGSYSFFAKCVIIIPWITTSKQRYSNLLIKKIDHNWFLLPRRVVYFSSSLVF